MVFFLSFSPFSLPFFLCEVLDLMVECGYVGVFSHCSDPLPHAVPKHFQLPILSSKVRFYCYSS